MTPLSTSTSRTSMNLFTKREEISNSTRLSTFPRTTRTPSQSTRPSRLIPDPARSTVFSTEQTKHLSETHVSKITTYFRQREDTQTENIRTTIQANSTAVSILKDDNTSINIASENQYTITIIISILGSIIILVIILSFIIHHKLKRSIEMINNDRMISLENLNILERYTEESFF